MVTFLPITPFSRQMLDFKDQKPNSQVLKYQSPKNIHLGKTIFKDFQDMYLDF